MKQNFSIPKSKKQKVDINTLSSTILSPPSTSSLLFNNSQNNFFSMFYMHTTFMLIFQYIDILELSLLFCVSKSTIWNNILHNPLLYKTRSFFIPFYQTQLSPLYLPSILGALHHVSSLFIDNRCLPYLQINNNHHILLLFTQLHTFRLFSIFGIPSFPHSTSLSTILSCIPSLTHIDLFIMTSTINDLIIFSNSAREKKQSLHILRLRFPVGFPSTYYECQSICRFYSIIQSLKILTLSNVRFMTIKSFHLLSSLISLHTLIIPADDSIILSSEITKVICDCLR